MPPACLGGSPRAFLISATVTAAGSGSAGPNRSASLKIRPARTFHPKLRSVAISHGRPRTSRHVSRTTGRPSWPNSRTKRAKPTSVSWACSCHRSLQSLTAASAGTRRFSAEAAPVANRSCV